MSNTNWLSLPEQIEINKCESRDNYLLFISDIDKRLQNISTLLDGGESLVNTPNTEKRHSTRPTKEVDKETKKRI